MQIRHAAGNLFGPQPGCCVAVLVPKRMKQAVERSSIRIFSAQTHLAACRIRKGGRAPWVCLGVPGCAWVCPLMPTLMPVLLQLNITRGVDYYKRS